MCDIYWFCILFVFCNSLCSIYISFVHVFPVRLLKKNLLIVITFSALTKSVNLSFYCTYRENHKWNQMHKLIEFCRFSHFYFVSLATKLNWWRHAIWGNFGALEFFFFIEWGKFTKNKSVKISVYMPIEIPPNNNAPKFKRKIQYFRRQNYLIYGIHLKL